MAYEGRQHQTENRKAWRGNPNRLPSFGGQPADFPKTKDGKMNEYQVLIYRKVDSSRVDYVGGFELVAQCPMAALLRIVDTAETGGRLKNYGGVMVTIAEELTPLTTV